MSIKTLLGQEGHPTDGRTDRVASRTDGLMVGSWSVVGWDTRGGECGGGEGRGRSKGEQGWPINWNLSTR